jgi:hypothetical protein
MFHRSPFPSGLHPRPATEIGALRRRSFRESAERQEVIIVENMGTGGDDMGEKAPGGPPPTRLERISGRLKRWQAFILALAAVVAACGTLLTNVGGLREDAYRIFSGSRHFRHSSIGSLTPAVNPQPPANEGCVTPTVNPQSAANEGSVLATVCFDPKAHRSPDNLTLTNLKAMSEHSPPHVNDSLVVIFSLTNDSQQPFRLDGTFVAWRDPSNPGTGQPSNSPGDNINRVLRPGETVNAKATIPLNLKGTWDVWPCYSKHVTTGQWAGCPNSWQHFPVDVN